MTKPTMLLWDNGFYYAYLRDENGKAEKQKEPINSDDLEIIAETPLIITFNFNGNVRDALVANTYKRLEQEALKYAELKKHKGFVTLDDHRKPGEDTIHIETIQLFQYRVKGNVLLLNKKK
jgi:DNA polymerase III alpha subunit